MAQEEFESTKMMSPIHVELFSRKNRLFQIAYFQFFLNQETQISKIIIPTFLGYIKSGEEKPHSNFLELFYAILVVFVILPIS